MKHSDLPWTYRDVSGAGLQIYGIVPFNADCAEFITKKGEQLIYKMLAYETWVQFEPAEWDEMQTANAEFIVKACNNHEKLIEAVKCMLIGAAACAIPHEEERKVLQEAVNFAQKAIKEAQK